MLQVQNLTKRYGAKVLAVNNLSFQTKEGEIYGLLGPNGAGKTTTLRMIATLLEPTEGSIVVAGFDVRTQGEQVRTSNPATEMLPSLGSSSVAIMRKVVVLPAPFGPSKP